MSKPLRIVKQYWQEVKWLFIKVKWVFFTMPIESDVYSTASYTLGITTYKERYESYLQPLVKKLVYLFPDVQIVIAVNGYHKPKEQKEYLQKIIKWTEPFKNVTLVTYEKPQGLCKLWNQILLKADSKKVFLFNEDINISTSFREDILQSTILNSEFGLINGSYSHFMMDKSVVKDVGWFDERFPGIGYEDHDFEIRMTLAKKQVEHIGIKGIKNENVVPKDWSYGDKQEVILTKYSGPNEKHYFSKWEFSDEEKEGFIHVRIIECFTKLINGMETPNFYPEIKLDEWSH